MYFPQMPKAKDKRIVIMGNGPSLKPVLQEFETQLRDETVLAVNFFVNSPIYDSLRPELYLLLAPELWIDNTNEMNEKRRDKLFATIKEKTTWDMQLFIPVPGIRSPYLKKVLADFPANIKIVPYNTTPVEGIPSWNEFYFRRNLGMPRPHNVIIPCLMAAINMGFPNIYVIGAEHSWLPEISVTDDNIALLHQKHFYDTGGSSSAKPMQKLQRRPRRLHEILEKFVLTFRGYHTIEDYSRSVGCRIYNCTPGSFIDAFERKALTDVLSGVKANTHE